ncbi:MAG: YutD family protein [Streptococcaceae bacterium]|jgi:uncharacterized protein YutD|nr:YutD family protein [Streptococcaceae bacterium]
MSKEIDESLYNYTKYPGPRVLELPENEIRVGEKRFLLVENYKDGFASLDFEHRYSDLFAKYDYIVGDWGHELLRLRGFYENDTKKVTREEKIDQLSQYLQEDCAYGCAYFVLQRVRMDGETDDEAFLKFEEDTKPYKMPRQRPERKPHQRQTHDFNELSAVKPDRNAVRADRAKKVEKRAKTQPPKKKMDTRKPFKLAPDTKKAEAPRNNKPRAKFTIRNRED